MSWVEEKAPQTAWHWEWIVNIGRTGERGRIHTPELDPSRRASHPHLSVAPRATPAPVAKVRLRVTYDNRVTRHKLIVSHEFAFSYDWSC